MNVWPFIPQRQFEQSLEWKTDVIRTPASEQRFALRKEPRYSRVHRYQLLPQEIEAATVMARDWLDSEFLLPFWECGQRVESLTVGQTTFNIPTADTLYSVGESVFIIGYEGSYETAVITGLTGASITVEAPGLVNAYSAAFMSPCYPVRFKDKLKLEKQSASYTLARASFTGTKPLPITSNNPYPLFNSFPVMTERSLIGGKDETQSRDFQALHNIAGPLFYSTMYEQAIGTHMIEHLLRDRAELHAFYEWLYHVKGKRTSFYAPRWTYDFELVAVTADIDTTLSFKVNDTLGDTYTGPICIVLKSGQQVYASITGWVPDTPSIVTVQLASAIGATIDPSEVELICRMPLVRYNSDRVELQFENTKEVELKLPLIEVPS